MQSDVCNIVNHSNAGNKPACDDSFQSTTITIMHVALRKSWRDGGYESGACLIVENVWPHIHFSNVKCFKSECAQFLIWVVKPLYSKIAFGW